MVAAAHVLQYGLVGVGSVALLLQLEVATHRARLGRGVDEDLELGVRKYRGAYVAAVHNYAAALSHSLLHSRQTCAYARNGRNGRNGIGHAQVAYFSLDIDAVEHCMLTAVGLHRKVDVYVRQRLLQSGAINVPLGVNHTVVEGV